VDEKERGARSRPSGICRSKAATTGDIRRGERGGRATQCTRIIDLRQRVITLAMNWAEALKYLPSRVFRPRASASETVARISSPDD